MTDAQRSVHPLLLAILIFPLFLLTAAPVFATSWTEAAGAVVNPAGYVYSPNISAVLTGWRLYSGTYPNLSTLLADCQENQVKDVLTTPPGSYTLEHFAFPCPTNPITPDGAYVFAYTTDGVGYQPQWGSGYYINATRSGGNWSNTSVQPSPGAFTLSGNGFCGLSNTRSVNLKWSVSSNATSYAVYRDGAIASTGSMILQDGLPAYVDFGLAAGTYTYFVRATNAAGSTDSNTVSLTVPVCGGQPVANFSFTPPSPTAGQLVTFSDTSTSAPTSWAWSFGDSQFSTAQSPTHTYASAGAYSVSLTASNAGGGNTVTKTVTVAAAIAVPVANFTFTPSSPSAGQQVNFFDTSTGSPSSWSWTFGDGAASTSQSPVHIYVAAGSYTVTLTATNDGGSNVTSKSIAVGTLAPTASFSFAPTSPAANQVVLFTDTSTGSPSSWSWTFGDGATSTSQNPAHTFSNAGSYSVSLTASNAGGSSSVTRSVTVSPATATLKADFSINPSSPAVDQQVNFFDTSTGSPSSWSWTFGDGATSTSQNPAHIYSNAGSYSVSLTVSNGAGSDSATHGVNVSQGTQPPSIVFSASPDRLVGGGMSTLSWSVANASTVSIDNNVGTRPATASVQVQVARTTQYVLTAVGAAGNAFRALTVRVDPPFHVSILIAPLAGVAPFTSTLQVIASGGVAPYTYTWSTGAHGSQATARWTNAGQYVITCTATDSRGNQVTSPSQVVSVSGPAATASLDMLDPNPGISGNVATTTPAILTKAPSIGGLAADGATLVLLRFSSDSPGSVRFSIGGDSCNDVAPAVSDDGGLSIWGADDRLGSVTQHTTSVGSRHQAFAVYHSPTDFWRSPSDNDRRDRPLTLRAQFTSDSGGTAEQCRQLSIFRPPVLLIHGIWPDKSTWTFPLVWDSRFDITQVSWDGYTSIADNNGVAHRGVETVLARLRSQRMAATRVDVIAHSMGGLLARAWAGDASFRRASNYNKGDYHSLITLNTPHLGSPLATALVDIRSHYLVFADFIIAAEALGKRISTCSGFWRPECSPGAIDDLQEGSRAIVNLPRPQVPTHAFVGEAGVQGLGCLTTLSPLAQLASIIDLKPSVDDFSLSIFGETTHDQVVGALSQRGWLPLSATDFSTSCDSAHTNVTNSGNFEYSSRIAQLLNTKVSDPTYNASSQTDTVSAVDQHDKQTVGRSLGAVKASSVVLRIDSPHDGSIVDGGTPVTVRVSATGLVTAITLLGHRLILEKAGSPAEFTVNLPDDVIGHEVLVAVAKVSDGTVAISAPIGIEVRRTALIESLQLEETSLTLLLPGHEQLRVTGMYSDGILRDVTNSALGTTYTSSDESIVVVSQDGLLMAKAPGAAIVTARNGASETATFVLVVPTPGTRRRAVSP